MDSWHPHRDHEGWKLSASDSTVAYWNDTLEQWEYASSYDSRDPPNSVTPAPRLRSDVESLLLLMASEIPPVRHIRSSKISVAIYGFRDASGSGFGGSFGLPNGDVLFRYGVWGRDSESASSNYRELNNLVMMIEEGIHSGELLHSELFVFTDNTTAESAYYRGNTDNKALFNLVLRLRLIDCHQLKLHIVHVAGTRMIQQGTDGLSRGDLSCGVMTGTDMISFVPLHLSVIDRAPALLKWIQSWCPLMDIKHMHPEDWFELGHGLQGGCYTTEGAWLPHQCRQKWFLWAPPPAAASAALDELCLSRHKRTHLNHIFICPRLFTSLWRKRLHKVSDVVLELPAGFLPWWPASCHEPLLLGLTLRFIRHPPWQLRQSPQVLDMGREVLRLWKAQDQAAGALLCQLCDFPDLLDSLSERVVQGMLYPAPLG